MKVIQLEDFQEARLSDIALCRTSNEIYLEGEVATINELKEIIPIEIQSPSNFWLKKSTFLFLKIPAYLEEKLTIRELCGELTEQGLTITERYV